MNVDGPLNAGDQFYGWGKRFTLDARTPEEEDYDVWSASEVSAAGLRKVHLTEEFIRDALQRETPPPGQPSWNDDELSVWDHAAWLRWRNEGGAR
jgi:hypothetical protein